MDALVEHSGRGGLERSCDGRDGDWIRFGRAPAGLERMEAFFSGPAYEPHRHDTYALGLTLAGIQCFTYRHEAANSVAGNVIVLHPDELHDGHSGAESGFRYRMLYVAPHLIGRALDQRCRALPFVSSAVTTDPRLVAALAPALRDLDRDLPDLEADDAVAAIADALLALDPTVRTRGRGRTCSVSVDHARTYLDAHYEHDVTSAELEAVTDLDRYALARHFRARLGTSPYRYVVMRRLDRARMLIGQGRPLAEVAAECGFADQSHMTRHFKRAYGLSPGRWRALHSSRRFSAP